MQSHRAQLFGFIYPGRKDLFWQLHHPENNDRLVHSSIPSLFRSMGQLGPPESIGLILSYNMFATRLNSGISRFQRLLCLSKVD